MTRSEHMKWAKERALAELDYTPNKPQNALYSIMSDLSKHEETKDHAGIMLTVELMFAGSLRTYEEVKRYIEGFN